MEAMKIAERIMAVILITGAIFIGLLLFLSVTEKPLLVLLFCAFAIALLIAYLGEVLSR